VGARWIQIFDFEMTQDELEAHSLSVENSSSFAFQHMLLRDSVFPSRSRSPVGQSKQVLRTYFPNSCFSLSLSLSLSPLPPPLSEEKSWIIIRHVMMRPYGKRPMVSRLMRDGSLLARHILLGTSFASLPTATINAEEQRECCALPRITWWMLTYSLMPILHTIRCSQPSCCYVVPLLSSRLVIPLRWCTAISDLFCFLVDGKNAIAIWYK